MAIPRCDAAVSFIRTPPIESSPSEIGSRPAIILSRVDLPQPDGPTKTTNSPLAICRSTPRMTSTAPKRFRTWLRDSVVISAIARWRGDASSLHPSRGDPLNQQALEHHEQDEDR